MHLPKWGKPMVVAWAWVLLWSAFPGAAAESSAGPRRVAPPPGMALAPSDRADLEQRCADLEKLLEALPSQVGEKTVVLPRGVAEVPLLSLLPDAAIYHKAVSWALAHDEFFRSNEVAIAQRLLDHGAARARELAAGRASWLAATGLVVRAYVSKIDGSIQPYGLVVPPHDPHATAPHRLDVWLHGRDNYLTELKFIDGRERSWGEFTPAGTLVLHPYGRYCNAFKFAGEVDVLEALDHVRSQYAVDVRRQSIRGFSMGGAGTWHLAVHHAGLWAGAAPGAGFAETAVYSGILKKQPDLPWYERALWHWYDATDYALNLYHCPTIAYSGEIDKQKQAADIMADAMQREGLPLIHLIGPNTAHRYEPETKLALSRQFDDLLRQPKNLRPARVRFVTWTLRYHRMHWLNVQGLERHWRPARLEGAVVDARSIRLQTTNVSSVALDPLPLPFPDNPEIALNVDGQSLTIRPGQTLPGPEGPIVTLAKRNGQWQIGSLDQPGELRKRPGGQGPIDDAFLDRFIMVRPTGKPWHEATGAWVNQQLEEAIQEWRAQFRGDVAVKNDVEVTDEDAARSHLILWGDPQSNLLLGRLLKDLPIVWDTATLRLGSLQKAAATHVPILVFPNRRHPGRYVVLNSGFTFSQEGRASNALQTPKLPDWAVISLRGESETASRGSVAAAGFFDEYWRWAELGD